MISLIKLASEGKIEKTGAKPKLPIKVDGVSSDTLDVYKIPLEYLYYNDRNGRIATGISQFDGQLIPVNDLENSEYNNFIAKLIKDDNPTALKKTKKSIQNSGQQVYGYVLDDGRIVDGNRRFTALRELHHETGRTEYFEAVVLPFSYNNQAERAKIKKLELAIQMGVEERQSYDPVDLAVDIYQTTSGEDPIMTRADYAADSHMRPTEVEKYYNGAVYMKKFLEFIGTSQRNFNIIKENKVWTLFYEMGKVLSKNFGDDPESLVRKNETMESYFGIILYQMHVGVVRNTARNHVHDYAKNIVTTANNDRFNEDVVDNVEELADALQENQINNTEDLMHCLSEEAETINEFGDTFDAYIRDAKNGESAEKFIESIKKSVKYYQDLNNNSGLIGNLRFADMNNDQLRELQVYMRDLNQLSKELFNKYGNELK